MNWDRGTVLWVDLNPAVGHEQGGVRPCVAISDPAVTSDQRYPVITVVPVTATPGEGALYPPLSPGSGGLAKQSYALIDQVRSIDKRRVRRVYGAISEEELKTVDQGLELFLGLDGEELVS